MWQQGDTHSSNTQSDQLTHLWHCIWLEMRLRNAQHCCLSAVLNKSATIFSRREIESERQRVDYLVHIIHTPNTFLISCFNLWSLFFLLSSLYQFYITLKKRLISAVRQWIGVVANQSCSHFFSAIWKYNNKCELYAFDLVYAEQKNVEIWSLSSERICVWFLSHTLFCI